VCVRETESEGEKTERERERERERESARAHTRQRERERPTVLPTLATCTSTEAKLQDYLAHKKSYPPPGPP